MSSKPWGRLLVVLLQKVDKRFVRSLNSRVGGRLETPVRLTTAISGPSSAKRNTEYVCQEDGTVPPASPYSCRSLEGRLRPPGCRPGSSRQARCPRSSMGTGSSGCRRSMTFRMPKSSEDSSKTTHVVAESKKSCQILRFFAQKIQRFSSKIPRIEGFSRTQYMQVAYAEREAIPCPNIKMLVVKRDYFETTIAKRYASRLIL